MQNKKRSLLQYFYSEHLKIINDIKLTPREIEIIAFFVCGRSAKKIASFFCLSPKTIENHVHNIMLKLGCNSRENIIDFIEKSGKLHFLRKYYTAILAQAAFDKCLKDILQQKYSEKNPCLIAYWQEHESHSFLAYHLETSLKAAGVNASLSARTSANSLEDICDGNNVIYIAPKNWNTQQIEEKEASLLSETKNQIFLLFPGEENPLEVLEWDEDKKFLDNPDQKACYFLIFEILKKILINADLDRSIDEFKNQYDSIEGLREAKSSPSLETRKWVMRRNNLKNILVLIGQNTSLCIIICTALIILIIIGCLKIKKNEEKIQAHRGNLKKEDIVPIRSDLNVPTESVFLDRPELIAQIENRFKGWSGIQTVALVGIGGAGKTTLARCYASLQKLPDVWEINAESKETLNESFEHLAKALSKTEEDQKILTGILEIKLFVEREEKLIQFVKEKLRSRPNWFLIYDNVVNFMTVQNYFPIDPGRWGQGRVILTTRDSNIENNKYINNTIFIKELNAEEKLCLFIKIMSNGGFESFTSEQKKDAQKFLQEIPSFPLDVTVAAFYLKTTHVSTQDYLKNLYLYNNDFFNVQEKILQETGEYTKTRYGIITLSLKDILKKNNNFKDLFLFVSLLDPQSIPRDLLVNFKGSIIVDDFIYHLKKYSLITPGNPLLCSLDSVFSIHRSTQAIVMDHLLKSIKHQEILQITQIIGKTLENYISEAINKEDFAKMKILARHAEQLLNHDKLINDYIKGSLSGELGCIYYYLCDYVKAKQFLNHGVSKLNKCKNKNDPKIAHFLVYLGNVHRRLGEHEAAKKLFEKSFAIYKITSSPHVDMARASGYLGIVYESLGDFKKARELLEKSLTIYKKYPQNRIGLAWSLAHLGSVFYNLGDYEKAKKLFEESLTIYKTFSENYVGAAWVCGSLGNVYLELGDYKKAKSLLEESLTISSKYFFEDHIYVAKALVQLGVFYRETKDYEKAKSLLKKGLIVFEKVYGNDHVETASIFKNLAQTYFLEGNLDIAESLLRKALEIYCKSKHPDQYIALETLAEIYMKKTINPANVKEASQADNLKIQAIAYLMKALEIIETHFPKESPQHTRIQSKIKSAQS